MDLNTFAIWVHTLGFGFCIFKSVERQYKGDEIIGIIYLVCGLLEQLIIQGFK